MLPNSDDKQALESPVGSAPRPTFGLVVGTASQPGDLSVFKASNTPAASFPAATWLETSDVEGTVGAAMPAAEDHAYGLGSRALLSDGPLGRLSGSAVAPSRRASLISELREISGQVNRMMCQVDRAIHRLGEHAGEPLRR